MRDGWRPDDPHRRCYTCGAEPSGHYRDGSPSYPMTCYHEPHVATDDELARWASLPPMGAPPSKRKPKGDSVRFERDADRERTAAIGRRITERLWRGVELRQTKDLHTWDFDVIRGGLVAAIVEAKSRDITWGDYPDILLSKALKVDPMVGHPLPAFLFIHSRRDDRLHWLRLDADVVRPLRTGFGGREPRDGATHDQEVVTYFPLALFTEAP